MKFYVLLLFSCFTLLHAAEQQQITARTPREWDAAAYAERNKWQEEAALRILRESDIHIGGTRILSLGCGTGNIEHKVALLANHVHGIDASYTMIAYANEHSKRRNQTFEQAFAENFATTHIYDIAFIFSCLHWIQDKQAVFKRVHNALVQGGDFLGNFQSTSDPEIPHALLFRELMPKLKVKYPVLQNYTHETEMTEFYVIPKEEFTTLMAQEGFEIVFCEQKQFDLSLYLTDIEKIVRPLVMSRPFIEQMSSEQAEDFFSYFIQKLKKRVNTQPDQYSLATTAFHVRKK